MRVTVTGASGLIGAALVAELGAGAVADGACPAACDGDWNHALRAAAHCFLPAPDGLNTA